jgi:hypothetical protein
VGKSIFGSKVTDSVQKDDLQMTVLGIGQLDMMAMQKVAGFDVMGVMVLIENRSANKKTELSADFSESLTGSIKAINSDVFGLGHKPSYKAKMKDEFGNTYDTKWVFPFSFRIDAKHGMRVNVSGESLAPEEKMLFFLGGSPPIEKANRLELAIPSPVQNSKDVFSFSLALKRENFSFEIPATGIAEFLSNKTSRTIPLIALYKRFKDRDDLLHQLGVKMEGEGLATNKVGGKGKQDKKDANNGQGLGKLKDKQEEKDDTKDDTKGKVSLDELQGWMVGRQKLYREYSGNQIKTNELLRETQEAWNKRFKGRWIKLEGQVSSVGESANYFFGQSVREKYVISGYLRRNNTSWQCATDLPVVDLKRDVQIEVTGTIMNQEPPFDRAFFLIENGKFKKKD